MAPEIWAAIITGSAAIVGAVIATQARKRCRQSLKDARDVEVGSHVRVKGGYEAEGTDIESGSASTTVGSHVRADGNYKLKDTCIKDDGKRGP